MNKLLVSPLIVVIGLSVGTYAWAGPPTGGAQVSQLTCSPKTAPGDRADPGLPSEPSDSGGQAMNWRNESGDWTGFRKLPGVVEVDFHRSGEEYDGNYSDMMAGLADEVLGALRDAQQAGVKYVLFTHGWSTSVGWKRTTARSVVRGLMRSPEATPYIIRRECIQHDSVFVAAIRSKQEAMERVNLPTQDAK